MTNPTKFSWTDPTTNVDGSAITAGEIYGYTVGIRNTLSTGSAAGTYPIQLPTVIGATAASELLSSLVPVLAPGTYAAAVMAVTQAGIPNSAWSSEADFTITSASAPVPVAPTGFTVA